MSSFKVDVIDRQVTDALRDLHERVGHLAPVMSAISDLFERQTEDNFAAQAGPLGPWPALKSPPERRQGGMILQDIGKLAASVEGYHTDDEAGIGTNVLYAAIQHMGGQTKPHTIKPRNKQALAFGGRVVKQVKHPGSKIPARPFLPVAPSGELQDGMPEEILGIIEGHLDGN